MLGVGHVRHDRVPRLRRRERPRLRGPAVRTAPLAVCRARRGLRRRRRAPAVRRRQLRHAGVGAASPAVAGSTASSTCCSSSTTRARWRRTRRRWRPGRRTWRGAAERRCRGPKSLHVGFVRAGGCDASTRGAACGLAAPEQYLRWEWCGTTDQQRGRLRRRVHVSRGPGRGGLRAPRSRWPPRVADARRPAAPPGWEGFLRPDAYLMVVIVAAADDASGPPDIAHARPPRSRPHQGLKPDPTQTLASAIVPRTTVSPARQSGAAPDRVRQQLRRERRPRRSVRRSTGARAGSRARSTNIDVIEPACVAERPRHRSRHAGAAGRLHRRGPRAPPPMARGRHRRCRAATRARRPAGACSRSSACWDRLPVDDRTRRRLVHEAGTNITVECLGCADANDPACATAR